MSTIESAKKTAERAVDDRRSELVSLSHEIWDHPELGFEEERASRVCAELLTASGFSVTMDVAGLETAFVASYGTGPFVVGICAEYDALPGIGHACGHNVIAAAGVGAGVALTQLADDLGLTIRVYGTPAEEGGGGGKITMLEAGLFDGVHAAMMVHPAPVESDIFPTLASRSCDYHFHGKTAHASLAPFEGVNAGDAMTIAQVGVGVMRQQLRPGEQVHGIITDGGAAANIIPDRTSARYQARANSLADLLPLEERVARCFEAGAHASGATLDMQPRRQPYSEFRHNEMMATSYRANAQSLGRTFTPRGGAAAGSTDMANLSLLMPTIHPSLGLDCAPAVNHQPEFAAHCRTEEADTSAMHGAIAMAMTAIDIVSDHDTRDQMLANDTTCGSRSSYPWRTPS